MPGIKEFIEDDGSLKEGWAGQLGLPPEIAGAEMLKTANVKNLAGLVTSVVADRSEIGRRPRVPTDLKDFPEFARKHLGAGAKPEEYEFERPKDLPAGATYDEAAEKAWAARAVELGIPKGIAKEAHKFFNSVQLDAARAAVQAQQERAAAAKQALEGKYGKELPKILAKAAQVYIAFTTEDHRKAMGATTPEAVVETLGRDPIMVEFLSAIAEHLGDDQFIQGKSGGSGSPDKDWKPRYPEWPDLYKNATKYPKEHAWFVGRGFDFSRMAYTKTA